MRNAHPAIARRSSWSRMSRQRG